MQKNFAIGSQSVPRVYETFFYISTITVFVLLTLLILSVSRIFPFFNLAIFFWDRTFSLFYGK